jgi:hypothetical protein
MHELAYTITISERGHQITHDPMPDPFHTTRIRTRGWRNALAVLLHRYELEIHVSADRDRAEAVLELNPDYLGPPGSASRRAWNAQLDRALHKLAAEN